MLDEELLEAFIDVIEGYGNPHGKYWLVGMEEGGGTTEKEVQSRLETWKKRGRQKYDDLAKFHEDFGQGHYFAENPKHQQTWNKLIRVILTANTGIKPKDNHEVKIYQRDRLGRADDETFLAELMPLPSPGARTWHYANPKWTAMPSLKDRNSYTETYGEERVKKLQKLVKRHAPKVVVFYGLGYQKRWEEVSQAKFEEHTVGNRRFLAAQPEKTLFVTVAQPSNAWGNDYWNKVGRFVYRNIS